MGFLDKILKPTPKPTAPAILEYSNDKEYSGCGITKIKRDWNNLDAKMNAPIILKHIQDSGYICASTNNPLTFFYRYDFMIKKTIELYYISKFVRFTGASPILLINAAIKDKQEAVSGMIDRAAEKISKDLKKVKTPKTALKKIDEFENSFNDFHDEMSDENIAKVKSLAENMRLLYQN